MADQLIYAQLSGRVYYRTDENRMSIPKNWDEKIWLKDDSVTGFSAGVYRNGNEIVIAFAGTNETMWKDFAVGNIPAGAGLSSAQITQAMTLTMDVMRDNPGANISFTGHSLGGGLASVMAIWFNKQAIVFDEALFLSAAVSPMAYKAAQNYITVQLGVYPTVRDYTPLDYPSRAGNVTNYYVSGEALQVLRARGYGIGAQTGIDFGWGLANGFEKVDPVDLHSQALMTAGWLSPAFREATFEVTNAVADPLN